MKRLGVLISGRGSNMAAIVEETRRGCLRGVAEVVVVVSNDPDAAGLELARGLGIPAIGVSSKGLSREAFEKAICPILEEAGADFVVLAGFMRIFTSYFVGRYPGRILNIHPADTNLYKGAHAYEWAFENRLEETYITVHLVTEALDAGPVLGREKVDLRGAASLDEIKARGLAVEHRLYPRVIRGLILGEVSPSRTG